MDSRTSKQAGVRGTASWNPQSRCRVMNRVPRGSRRSEDPAHTVLCAAHHNTLGEPLTICDPPTYKTADTTMWLSCEEPHPVVVSGRRFGDLYLRPGPRSRPCPCPAFSPSPSTARPAIPGPQSSGLVHYPSSRPRTCSTGEPVDPEISADTIPNSQVRFAGWSSPLAHVDARHNG